MDFKINIHSLVWWEKLYIYKIQFVGFKIFKFSYKIKNKKQIRHNLLKCVVRIKTHDCSNQVNNPLS